LTLNPHLIRNRRKLEAAVKNAKAFLKIQEKYGSFDAWVWHFTDGRPISNHWKSIQQIPTKTPLSDTISEEMRKASFCWIGSVTMYAHMQAIGIVNDHLVDCFRHAELLNSARQ
jgi:DNA-3-methyladenine glycosylase I